MVGQKKDSQEQIEEQLERAGFMSRREEEVLLVDALQRILDPWHDLVYAALVSVLVDRLSAVEMMHLDRHPNNLRQRRHDV